MRLRILCILWGTALSKEAFHLIKYLGRTLDSPRGFSVRHERRYNAESCFVEVGVHQIRMKNMRVYRAVEASGGVGVHESKTVRLIAGFSKEILKV